MSKKILMKKIPKFVVIAFFIICSISLYAQEEKGKVDKEKLDKLISAEKGLVEMEKEIATLSEKYKAMNATKETTMDYCMGPKLIENKMAEEKACKIVAEINAVGSVASEVEKTRVQEIRDASKKVFDSNLDLYKKNAE